MLMVTINSSIVIISLPAIFRGVHLDPLSPGNVSYLLWLLMGFLLTSAVLVVMFGRLGDMFGRVRIYNAGFVVFTLSAIALSFDPFDLGGGALWLIVWRVIQGVGGAMLMANSAAILTDAFPASQRGIALGINQVAAVAGSFLGLLIGGLLAEWDWKAVFWVSVPFGIVGTIWSYRSLHDNGVRTPGSLDLPGTITFALGLTALLTGITYGIQPHGDSKTGWTNPWVLAAVIGGIALLVIFCVIEAKTPQPMFNLGLFRNRTFALGNFAGLMASVGRGGMQFMLIIWLQGIWLPLHGYDYESTPLWAGIYMLPLTIGFLVAGPLSGWLSDKYGGRKFAAGGLFVSAVTFVLLVIIPVDFNYWLFALVILLNGLGTGVFTSPNTAEVMSAVPASQRGVASGMRSTLMNGGMALSIGIFFSLMIVGLSGTLPGAMNSGLREQGVPADVASQIADLPPVGSLFATFLGYNPFKELLGPSGTLDKPGVHADVLTGQEFFPHLISGPFHSGLIAVFLTAAVMMLLGSIASWFARGDNYVEHETAEVAEAAREGLLTDGDATAALAADNGSNGRHAVATAVRPAPVRAPLADGRTISGQVRRADGHPVAGVALTLIDQRGHQVSRASGDRDGGYVIEPPAPGSYVLIVSAGGHQPAAVTVGIDGQPQRLDVTLQGSGELTGRVLSAKGRPVAGATVTLTDMRGEVVGAAVSDGDGSYVCPGVVSGTYTLVVIAERMRPTATMLTVPDSGVLEHDIELAPLAMLTGSVRADGRPVPDAQVTVRDEGGTVLGTARTDDEGRYTVTDLPEGDYTVIARGYPPVTTRVAVNGGAVEHDVHLGFDQPSNGTNGHAVERDHSVRSGFRAE
ncbi:MFS transporter [Nocardia sp. NPDC004068]|uniref:MFS transporter n=1 Tax=Nocardia sp. NPDC004068 TaxID=3364303 RepID=UPI00369C0759